MWRLTARETIKKYLEGRLEQEVFRGLRPRCPVKMNSPWQVSHTCQGQIGTMPNNFTPIIGVESENVNENHKNYDQKPVWHPGDYP